jgi:hypothetical protein
MDKAFDVYLICLTVFLMMMMAKNLIKSLLKDNFHVISLRFFSGHQTKSYCFDREGCLTFFDILSIHDSLFCEIK